jgi:hypothetical protein
MDDVDLLVLDDWSAARRIVEGLGFEAAVKGDHAWGFRPTSLDRRNHDATSPPARVFAAFVELHGAAVSAAGAFRIDHEGLWTRSRILGDPPRRVPSLEDLTILSALHLTFQHGLEARLGQWLDLRRLLEQKELDARVLVERASEWGAARALGLALAVAQRLVGARVPLAASALPVPRSLLGGIADPHSGPLRLPLARVRWHLAKGRRSALLLDTLAPRPLDGPKGSGRPLWAIAGRLLRLARRQG